MLFSGWIFGGYKINMYLCMVSITYLHNMRWPIQMA